MYFNQLFFLLYIKLFMVVVVKKRFLNYCERIIRKNRKNISNDELEVICYGLESLYLTLTKIIVILILAILLGIFKEVIIMLISYNIIRLFAFGLHSKTSFGCLVSSIILFIGGAYISMYLSFSIIIRIIGSIISVILIALYAPADTEKRPLINKGKRIRYKFYSIIISTIVSILIIYYKNNITNFLFVGLIEEVIMILPITYKILGLSYNNYKTYK